MCLKPLSTSGLWLGLSLVLAVCGTSTTTSPTPTDNARLLLVGQSNADGLGLALREKINLVPLIDYNAKVADWVRYPLFAESATHPDLIAFVWWQGAADIETPPDEYVLKLRELIVIARTVHRDLPVRIIEIPITNGRALVHEAQAVVVGDPGVQLIPTADLTPLPTGHFSQDSYNLVRDRVLASLGR